MQQGGVLKDRVMLVVEDDVELRNSLISLLETDGCEVIGASNGIEALDYLRKRPRPDVILLDLMMPIQDGWAFRVEQKRDPALASIPVVAMSADDSPKAAAIDAECYVRKPFHYPDLLANLTRVMQADHLANLDRLASLGTLAAGIAHEINNPLTYVVNNLAILEHGLPRLCGECADSMQRASVGPSGGHLGGIGSMGEFEERLREVQEGVERIRRIVAGVQAFSRRSDDVRTVVHIEPILDQSVQLVQGDARQRALIVKDYQPTPPVLANAGRLGQAILNVLLNAIAATPEGDPLHHLIRISTRTDDSGALVLEISDTGAGIAPQDLARIFEPFFTTKPVGSGTGLGLSICHGIVASLGGEISASSVLGRGTTFRIVLPATKHQPPSASAFESRAAKAKARVLIVDDEPIVGRSLKRRLELHGIAAVIVTSGQQALGLLLSPGGGDTFDAVLCDLHMPGINGMDVYSRLLAEQLPVAKRLIFLTGGIFTEAAQRFLERTGVKWLEKPCDFDMVRAAILDLGRERENALQ